MKENDSKCRRSQLEQCLGAILLVAGMMAFTLFALYVAWPSRGEAFHAPILEGMTSFGCDAVTILPSERHVDFISHARAWAEHGQGRDWTVSLAEHHDKSLVKARGRAQHDCAGWIKRMEALLKTHPMIRPRPNGRGPERAREASPWRESNSGS
jgi:hypothetical protein